MIQFREIKQKYTRANTGKSWRRSRKNTENMRERDEIIEKNKA